MTKQIPLTQGKVALVDDDDYEELSKHKWYAYNHGRTFYASRRTPNGKGVNIRMHRQVLGLEPDDGKEVDHKNRNGLDNRRLNLRLVSRTINVRNRRKSTNNSSGFNGVHWYARHNKWQAYIDVDGKRVHLGNYGEIEDAVEARRQGEIEYWGEER